MTQRVTHRDALRARRRRSNGPVARRAGCGDRGVGRGAESPPRVGISPLTNLAFALVQSEIHPRARTRGPPNVGPDNGSRHRTFVPPICAARTPRADGLIRKSRSGWVIDLVGRAPVIDAPRSALMWRCPISILSARSGQRASLKRAEPIGARAIALRHRADLSRRAQPRSSAFARVDGRLAVSPFVDRRRPRSAHRDRSTRAWRRRG